MIDLTLDDCGNVNHTKGQNEDPSQERQRSLSGLRDLFRTTKSATEAAVSSEAVAKSEPKERSKIKGEDDSNSNNNGNNNDNSTALERRRARRQLAALAASNNNNNDNDDDDVEVVAAPAKKIKLTATVATDNNGANDNADVEMVGVANEAKLPHMRQVRKKTFLIF